MPFTNSETRNYRVVYFCRSSARPFSVSRNTAPEPRKCRFPAARLTRPAAATDDFAQQNLRIAATAVSDERLSVAGSAEHNTELHI